MNDAKEKAKQILAALQSKGLSTQRKNSLNKYPITSNILDMSQNQKRIWLHEQQATNKTIYNLPLAFYITGSINIKQLELACHLISKRHETLRTTFKQIDQQYQQIIHEILQPLVLEIHATEKPNDISSILRNFIEEPFDLTLGPLVKIAVIQIDNAPSIFVLNMHHIISDGISLSIFLKELLMLYDGIQPQPLTRQYSDYTEWQKRFSYSDQHISELAFWKIYLHDLHVLELSTDKPRKTKKEFKGKRESIVLDKAIEEKIHQFVTKNNATFFEYFFTLFGILLHSLSQQHDFAIGLVTANRTFPETEELIGFFANTFPLRFSHNLATDFITYLDKIKADLLKIYEHQNLAFEELTQLDSIERKLCFTPLIQSLFVMRDFGDTTFKTNDFKLHHIESFNHIALFELMMNVTKVDGHYTIAIDYDTNLFYPSTIKRFLHFYSKLIQNTLEPTLTSVLSMIHEAPLEFIHINLITDFPAEPICDNLSQQMNVFKIKSKTTCYAAYNKLDINRLMKENSPANCFFLILNHAATNQNELQEIHTLQTIPLLQQIDIEQFRNLDEQQRFRIIATAITREIICSCQESFNGFVCDISPLLHEFDKSKILNDLIRLKEFYNTRHIQLLLFTKQNHDLGCNADLLLTTDSNISTDKTISAFLTRFPRSIVLCSDQADSISFKTSYKDIQCFYYHNNADDFIPFLFNLWPFYHKNKNNSNILSSPARTLLNEQLLKVNLSSLYTHFANQEINPASDLMRNDKTAQTTINQSNTFSKLNDITLDLLSLWRTIFKKPSIQIHDNFFSLGGHSLQATTIASKISSIYQINFPLTALFENQTIHQVATTLINDFITKQYPQLPSLTPSGQYEHIPLSRSQELLWQFYLMQPNTLAYNLTVENKLTGEIHSNDIQQAIEYLLKTFDAFQLYFTDNEYPNVLSRMKNVNNVFTRVNLIPLSEENKKNQLDVIREKILNRPFALESGEMPYHFTLIILSSDTATLFFSGHHILFDAWSFNIIMDYFLKFYRAIRENNVIVINQNLLQFSDYTIWERKYFDSILSSQQSYWENELTHFSHLQLPHDFTDSKPITPKNNIIEIRLPAEASHLITNFSTELSTTPFVILLTVFSITLAYFCGQDDLVFGIPFANRNFPLLDGIVGYLINTLPFRIILEKSRSLRLNIKEIHQKTINAQNNQNISINQILSSLEKKSGEIQDNPIRVLFNYTNISNRLIDSTNLSCSITNHRSIVSKYDLSCAIETCDNSFTCYFEYNSTLFKNETIVFFAKLFEMALPFIVSHIDQPLSSVFNQIEKKLFSPLSVFPSPSLLINHTSTRQNNTNPIYALFKSQAIKFHNKIAIKTRDQHISYEDLLKQISCISHAIIKLPHAQTISKIGLMIDNKINMVAAIFTILALNKTYIPLASDYPEERLKLILENASPDLLITDKSFALPAKNNVPILEIQQLAACDQNIVHQDFNQNQLAYILYTSGSTGTPKGVMQSYNNLLSHILIYSNNLAITNNDTILQLASFNFDASLMDLYSALLNGATLVIANVSEIGISETLNLIKNTKVTIFHSVPTLYRNLFKSDTQMDLSLIRYVVLGGEEVYLSDLILFKARFGKHSKFINGFGPSESTLATQYILSHSSTLALPSVPIGYPVYNMQIVLLDDALHFAGQAGQIGLISPYLALGYYNDINATQKAFVTLPNSSVRCYLTGDYGRKLPDGSLIFCGRKDSQIKIRGIKVSLSEIESAVLSLPFVDHAVVLPIKQSENQYSIAVFFKANESTPCFDDLFREDLRKTLPTYMMPDVYINIDFIPLTPTGKIDRKALVRIYQNHKSASTVPFIPHTETEKIVDSIWKKILHLEIIDQQKTFFEQGGNSLALLTAHQELERRLNKKIPLITLFKFTTPDQLSLMLADDSQPAESSSSKIDNTDMRKNALKRFKKKTKQGK